MKKILSRIILVMPLWLAIAGHHVWLWPGAGAGVALGVLLIYAGIRAGKLPLIEKTKIGSGSSDYRVTGRNWPLYVEIDDSAPEWRATLAQEIWESIHKTNPINYFRVRSKSGQRELELMGHEVTVQAAVMLYGVAEGSFRKTEAHSMSWAYPELFGGVDVESELAKRRSKAREWVRDNKERFK
jgi:hypothetical protein